MSDFLLHRAIDGHLLECLSSIGYFVYKAGPIFFLGKER